MLNPTLNESTVRVKLCFVFVRQFWNKNTVIMVLVNSKKCCLCSLLDKPQMLLSAHSAEDHTIQAVAHSAQYHITLHRPRHNHLRDNTLRPLQKGCTGNNQRGPQGDSLVLPLYLVVKKKKKKPCT